MLSEQFKKSNWFSKPDQFCYVSNPTRQEVIKLLDTITHHIIIEGDTKFGGLVIQKGWKRNRFKKLPLNQYHYFNDAHVPESMWNMWGCYNYADYYRSVIKRLPNNATAFEIGTFHGKSAIDFGLQSIQSRKNIVMFTLDNYSPNFGMLTIPRGEYHKNINMMKHFGVLGTIIPLVGNSTKFHEHIDDESIDFLFIDGYHKSPIVDQDIENWSKKVKKGGIISGHDYCGTFPDVINAVNKKFGVENITTHDGQVWEYIKPLNSPSKPEKLIIID